MEESEMERDMRQYRVWTERQNRHQYIIEDEIEPVKIDNPSRNRKIQAAGKKLRQGEHGMWQEGRQTRFQEMARDQNPASHRREENRRLGSANFLSMESSQEAKKGKRGRGWGKKTLFERKETEEERRKRFKRNEQSILRYRKSIEKENEIMNGTDSSKKREVERKRLKNLKWGKEYRERKKLNCKLGEKQQEPEIMEEVDLLVRTTVRSKQFRKYGINSRFQQKAEERRKAQTLVEEEEDNDEDEEESEDECRIYWDGEEDDE